MKKIIFITVIIMCLSILSCGDKNSDDNMKTVDHSSMKMEPSTIDVMTPIEEITSEKFDNYEKYEKFSHQLMMADNSKYLTNDSGNIFAVYMTLHHEAAVVTSLGIKETTTDPEVTKLASGIAEVQIKEVKEMQNLLSSSTLKGNDSNGFNEKMKGIMDSMMSEMKMPDASLIPQESTKLYIENMIVHHEGAIKMAEEYIKIGKDPKLLEISNSILKTQGKEIEQMEKMLEKYQQL